MDGPIGGSPVVSPADVAPEGEQVVSLHGGQRVGLAVGSLAGVPVGVSDGGPGENLGEREGKE